MKKQKGFTLIELLVVIAIIGILTSIGIASFTRAQRKARDARRTADIEAIASALQLYYSDNNQYPAGGWDDITQSWIDNTLNQPAGNVYMRKVPIDPTPGTTTLYRYQATASRQCYCLEANFELLTATDSTCTIGLQSGYDYGRGCP